MTQWGSFNTAQSCQASGLAETRHSKGKMGKGNQEWSNRLPIGWGWALIRLKIEGNAHF